MFLDCGMGMGMGGGCMTGGGINHSSLALLLIALGIGAIVKYKAIKATSCQTFGKVVGMFIMIVAALGLICTAVNAYKARSCHMDKKCHEMNEMNEMKMPQGGMQLPPGHPDITKMPAPAAK